MKQLILIFALLVGPIAACAQVQFPYIIPSATDPNGKVCTTDVQLVWYAGTYYGCDGTGHYASLGGGGGTSATVTISTSSPVTVTTAGFYFNNAAGALTFLLPTIASGDVGKQWCFRNYTAKTGAITITAPAATYIDLLGANGSAAGTLVSAGAAGDSACVTAVTTTQYMATTGAGTWVNN